MGTLIAVESLGYVLRALLGATFVWYGYFDVRPSPERKEEFRRWGFGPKVQPTGGILQFASAALMLLPETVAYGAALMVVMMLFSLYVHSAREYQPRQLPWPAVLAVLAAVAGLLYVRVAWGLATVL